MMNVRPIQVDQEWCTAVDVQLPKTRLLAITTETGYVMCGALDVELLKTKLSDRKIIAARAVGVRTIEDLLNGQVESCTQEAEALGIYPGTSIRTALLKMRAHDKIAANE